MSNCMVRVPRVTGFERLFQDGCTEHLKYLEKVKLIGKTVRFPCGRTARVHGYNRRTNEYLVRQVLDNGKAVAFKILINETTGMTVV